GESSFRELKVPEETELQESLEERSKSDASGKATHPSTTTKYPPVQSHQPTLPPSTLPLHNRNRRRINPLLRWIRLLLFAASIGRVAGTNIEVRELSTSQYANQTSGLALADSGDG